jgi:hypothetical protein
MDQIDDELAQTLSRTERVGLGKGLLALSQIRDRNAARRGG